jgi:NAD(P) transhydrogenase subunit alpha
MIIGIPKEILGGEHRVAALPETVQKYVRMGFDVLVQSSLAEGISRSDTEYAEAGARVVDDPETLFAQSDVVLKVKQPCFNQAVGKHEAEMIREGAILITFLHPAAPANHAMIRTLSARSITALTMDGIPRIPRAQKMDALTSMSTLTGYKCVLIAADRFPKLIPMIGTAIGATKPASFFILGAGVVGLQAIATARRLGGTVKAVDIREDARQEAGSLKASVVGFEVSPEQAVGEGGYAKALTPELIEREREAIGPVVEESDILILSALVPGEVAPVLVTEAMVKRMRPGSVIMDVAVDQGGNCSLTEPGREVVKHGVRVCGLANIPGSIPVHASWLYASNVFHYMENLFKNGTGVPDLEDEIVRHTLVTFHGRIVHEGALKAMGQTPGQSPPTAKDGQR